MEQSLREHKDYIVELQEDSVRQSIEYDRALAEAWRDREDWRAQCLARQLYIKHTIGQIYKAICKTHEMFDKVEALRQSFALIGRNGQQLLNFIEEVKDHYEQVKAFYGYNCNMLNNVESHEINKETFILSDVFRRDFQFAHMHHHPCVHFSCWPMKRAISRKIYDYQTQRQKEDVHL